MAQIRVYTEPIIAKTRPSGLANSVHMALRTNGEYEPLHSGYGILFPKADISGDNTILVVVHDETEAATVAARLEELLK